MKLGRDLPETLKITSVHYDHYKNNPKYDADRFAPVSAISNIDGTRMYVFGAPMIRALSQGFGVPFEILIPPEIQFGAKLPDGNWTGMIGMVHRGEADISVPGLTISKDRREAVKFSYPIALTSMGFITDKAEPHTKSFAMFDTFTPEVWITVGVTLMLVSLVFCLLLRRQRAYSNILLRTMGTLLEKELDFSRQTSSVSLLMASWILGTTILISSYKAVILSLMTVPTMVGVRDLSDLARASATQPSFQCFTYREGITSRTWQNLSDSRLREIGKCVERNELTPRSGIGPFYEERAKKAYVGEKLGLSRYSRDFFVSDESMFLVHLGVAYSETFCCPEMLDKIIFRIVEGGLYKKFSDHLDFLDLWNQPLPFVPVESPDSIKVLSLEDLLGAFLVLLVGLLASVLTFLAEILSKASFCSKR